jgi:Serine/threonine protein kinase
MDYIVGAPVTRFAVAQKLSTRQRLELFLKICDAVEFAHRNLVVHRDIKPSNILANAEGSRSCSISDRQAPGERRRRGAIDYRGTAASDTYLRFARTGERRSDNSRD